MNRVILYSSETTERLTYIASLLINKLLGLELNLTNNIDVYKASSSIQINYSNNPDLPGYVIQPSSLLFEKHIRSVSVQRGDPWHSTPAIVLDDSTHFDILASSFYLVSRYEEYLPFEKDDYDRFTASQSCLLKLGVLQRPIVNEWAKNLLKDLTDSSPALTANPRKFDYLSTIDIDQAWKYHNKGFSRSVGGFVRDIIKQEWQSVGQRISVLLEKTIDPFYNFDWQDEVHGRFPVDVHYFLQVGGRGKFDKNTDISNSSFQQLIKRLDSKYPLGIHPSYKSNTKPELVAQERQALANIVAHDVESSRQHFLMHTMPDTYQRLCDLGITQDHTMGYSTHLGFRAGIAAPFLFFDLSTNETTTLELIPFCCMDITPLHYMKQSPKEAVTTVIELMEYVKSVGGLFVSLWHNESMSEDGRWQGWSAVYTRMIEYAYKLKSDNER